MDKAGGEIVNVNQAAAILDTTREKVRRLLRSGELSGFTSVLDLRSRFVRLDDVHALKARDLQPLGNARPRRRDQLTERSVA